MGRVIQLLLIRPQIELWLYECFLISYPRSDPILHSNTSFKSH